MTSAGPQDTLPARFFANARRLATQVAHYYPAFDRWLPVGWATMAGIVRDFASGLIALGHEPSLPVAIIAATRREWTYIDLAIMATGGITVGVYPDLDDAESREIVNHCRARICVVEGRGQALALLEQQALLPNLERIVVLDAAELPADTPQLLSYDDVLALGRRAGCDIDRCIAELSPTDAATFMYTSGRDGPVKGAMLTHGNLVAGLHGLARLQLTSSDRGFAFLPLAHALPRAFEHLSWWLGMQTVYGRGAEHLVDDLLAMRPTAMFLTPPVLEHLHGAVYEDFYTLAAGRKLLTWASNLGKYAVRQRRHGRRVATHLEAPMHLARRLVFNRLRTCLGGRMRHLYVAGGALSPALAHSLEAGGVRVTTGWAMTETAGVGTLTRPGDFGDDPLIASIGQPLPNIELDLARDGELLVRGPSVFSGYYKSPAATTAAFTTHGYLRTGDIARVDDRGDYHIVDRKADMIHTAAGVTIAPRRIERLVCADPRVAQIVVVGAGRPFLTALIGVSASLRDLFDEDTIAGMLEDVIVAVNIDLNRAQQIHQFRLLPYEIGADTGELTALLQIRRDVVIDRFDYLIDEMYVGNDKDQY